MRIDTGLWPALLVCICIGSNAAEPKKSAALTADQAKALAEAFVADNGYTDLPPNRSRIAYESIEWYSDLEEMLASRRDTLERRASRVDSGRSQGQPGWFVVFRYRGPTYRQHTGRAVTMDLDGSNMRMEHKAVFLKRPKRTAPKKHLGTSTWGRCSQTSHPEQVSEM